MEQTQGLLSFAGEIRTYVLGGNSTFTLVSKKSGERFTYQVRSAKKNRDANWSTGNQDRSQYFVSVLTGGDNVNAYTYMGMLKQDINGEFRFTLTRGSKIRDSAPSCVGFVWFWNLLEQGCIVHKNLEFWHEGSCCMCGRKLTVPESVADGIGPECRSKAMAA